MSAYVRTNPYPGSTSTAVTKRMFPPDNCEHFNSPRGLSPQPCREAPSHGIHLQREESRRLVACGAMHVAEGGGARSGGLAKETAELWCAGKSGRECDIDDFLICFP